MATTDYAPLLVEGLSKAYEMVGKTYPLMAKELFHVNPSKKRYEQVQHFGGYGLPQARLEGNPLASGATFTDFGKQYVHTNYALSDVIPQEAIDDDVYGMLVKWASSRGGSMAESYVTLQEITAANYFKNVGFATSLPPGGSPDGRALFDTAHPISAIDPTNTVANRPSVEINLSNVALQAARANLEQQKKANGLTKIRNSIKILIVNPNNEEIAIQLTQGSWVANTADRNINTLQRKNIRVFSWPYWEISGAANATAYNSWAVQGEEHYMEWWDRQAVKFRQQYILGVNSILFASFIRFVLGHSSWRGMYGSKGT